MKRILVVVILLTVLLSACASKEGSGATGTIKVSGAWARQAMAMGDTSASANGAVYMVVENTGSAPDLLLSAESDAAGTVEVHHTTLENDVMIMAPVETVEIPASGKVEFKTGGYHVMLIGLKQDLKAGEKIHVKLTFQNSGALELDVPIRGN